MAGAYRDRGDMSMKSHYVAMPLSEATKKDLREMQEALANDAKQLNLRRSDVTNGQLTLGVYKIPKLKKEDSSEELIETVNKILKELLEKRPPLELNFGSLGNFGSQIVFINVTNVKELQDLRRELNDRLKEEEIFLADQRFTPHVTLFRAGHNYGGRHGRHQKEGGSEPRLSMGDMVRRTDLPSVTSSPVKEIEFKRLLGC